MTEKQKLKQKFEDICKAYATSEEKNKMYLEAVKELLQQKQQEVFAKMLKYQISPEKIIKELLKELTEKKEKKQ